MLKTNRLDFLKIVFSSKNDHYTRQYTFENVVITAIIMMIVITTITIKDPLTTFDRFDYNMYINDGDRIADVYA